MAYLSVSNMLHLLFDTAGRRQDTCRLPPQMIAYLSFLIFQPPLAFSTGDFLFYHKNRSPAMTGITVEKKDFSRPAFTPQI